MLLQAEEVEDDVTTFEVFNELSLCVVRRDNAYRPSVLGRKRLLKHHHDRRNNC